MACIEPELVGIFYIVDELKITVIHIAISFIN